jgi:hypothetical protein
MNFDPYSSSWREQVPQLTLVEQCWQLKSPGGRLLTCGVFRTLADSKCGAATQRRI